MFSFLRFYLFTFRERGEGREKERERSVMCEGNNDRCLSHGPNQGPGPQPRHVP